MVIENPTIGRDVGNALPIIALVGAGIVVWRWVMPRLTAAASAVQQVSPTTNDSGLTFGPPLGWIAPSPGSGPPTDALRTCPPGSVLTQSGPTTFSALRAQLVAQNYPGAAMLDDGAVISAFVSKTGQFAIPC